MAYNWEQLSPKLQGILDEATAKGEEKALQLEIYDHGDRVVSLASGTDQNGRSINVDDIMPIFSCGKPVMATAVHCLVQKGLISYDLRVGDVWPEFDCNGKEKVLFWHILTHRSGLHILPKVDKPEDYGNWELMCQKMAEATPAWEPGTKCGYQGITHAWLVGETVRRAVGKPFKQVIEDEVFKPLGIKDFYFGTTPEADARMIRIDSSDFESEEKGWCGTFIHNDAVRHGFVPSANGVANAKSLARHYAALTEGGVDGVQLLTKATIDNATIFRRWEQDPPKKGDWAMFGLGYALGPEGNLGDFFGQGGAAGSEGFAVRSRGLAIALTKNRPLRSSPVHPIRDRISEALGLEIRHW